jgi:hypothetical protein
LALIGASTFLFAGDSTTVNVALRKTKEFYVQVIKKAAMKAYPEPI